MTDSVNAPGQVSLTVPGATGGEAAAARGQFRGERVQHVRNPTAELQDAAEELSFSQSEVVEKKLSQRKLKSSRLEPSAAVEQAQKYLREVPDLERNQKLSDFASSVLNDRDTPSRDMLRSQARKFSGDETHQFLALSYARDQAVEQGAAEALLTALDEALTELETEQGPAIRAGLNVSELASEHAGRVGDAQHLRDVYRDVVLDCKDIHAAYARVVADHPGKDFDDALRFMLKALGADLAASSQSVSKPRIRQLMDDMYQLKSLNTVHEQCEDLIRRVQRNFDADLPPHAPRELMGELLSAQDRAWQGADAFKGLPAKMGLHGDGDAIYFLQGFKELLRFVPLKAFGDDATKRERVMVSLQQALDLAIDNEQFDD